MTKGNDCYNALLSIYHAVRRQGYQTQDQHDEAIRIIEEAPFSVWPWERLTLPKYPIKDG